VVDHTDHNGHCLDEAISMPRCHEPDSYDASVQVAEELWHVETAAAADAERFAGYAEMGGRD
jgi:hypothetical protein